MIYIYQEWANIVTYNMDKLHTYDEWKEPDSKYICIYSLLLPYNLKARILIWVVGKTNYRFLYGKDKIEHGEFSSMWMIIRKWMMRIVSAEGSDEEWMWKYWGGKTMLGSCS